MSTKIQCLILACGNTLRGDDGVGPALCTWAAERFASNPGVRTIARQQWTPDLAEEIAGAHAVIFIDCSVASAPGELKLQGVEPATPGPGLATHHSGAPELLQLAKELYGSLPAHATLLTIGAGSTEFGEVFSSAVMSVIPEAQALLENTVRTLLQEN